MITNGTEIFDRSGLATLSDLESLSWKELTLELEKTQNEFAAKQLLFRSPEYKWPSDALHCWSRVWEYPYVYHHIRRCRKEFSENRLPSILDLGSGVTFFPFSVAKLGCDVICADIDPICERDLTRAAEAIEHSPGKVRSKLVSDYDLPFRSEEIDIVYCVSVLEHVGQFERTVIEVARVLKRRGLFILTVDLGMRGEMQLGIDEHRRLLRTLEDSFSLVYPERLLHPGDILYSSHGPYAIDRENALEFAWFILKQRILKPILGRRAYSIFPSRLAVQGYVWRKK